MSEMAYDFASHRIASHRIASHRIASQAYADLFSMLKDKYVGGKRPSYLMTTRFFGAGVILCSERDWFD